MVLVKSETYHHLSYGTFFPSVSLLYKYLSSSSFLTGRRCLWLELNPMKLLFGISGSEKVMVILPFMSMLVISRVIGSLSF